MLNVHLKTKRLNIRRYHQKDLEQVFPLFLDDKVLYYYLPDPIQVDSKDKLGEFLLDWDNDETCFLFSCYLGENLVAIFSLEQFSLQHNHTECGIALIEPQYYGKGYAIEIVQIFLSYLFDQIGLNKIFVRYIAGNKNSYRLFNKMGFKSEGRLRQHVKRDNIYLDMHYMGILRKEYNEQKLNHKRNA